MATNTSKQLSLGSAKPILKWAGGKTQMLNELLPKIPSSYGRYIEPFLAVERYSLHCSRINQLLQTATPN